MNIAETVDNIWARPQLSDDDYKTILKLLKESPVELYMLAAGRLHRAQDVLASRPRTNVADQAGAFILYLISDPVTAEYIDASDKLSAVGDIVTYCAKDSPVRQGGINKIADLLEDPAIVANLKPKDRATAAQYVLKEKGVDVDDRDVEAWIRSLLVLREHDTQATLASVDGQIAGAFQGYRYEEAADLITFRNLLVATRNNYQVQRPGAA